jgi:hypothetical protein
MRTQIARGFTEREGKFTVDGESDGWLLLDNGGVLGCACDDGGGDLSGYSGEHEGRHGARCKCPHTHRYISRAAIDDVKVKTPFS